MRFVNRVVPVLVILLAAAGLAAFLRARGDRHRLGVAIDLDGSLAPVAAEFNRAVDQPRLLMVLSPACPVCLEGAETVHRLLREGDRELRVLAVWMEALPFDITRNPARRVEPFADEPRMLHFYDMQQVSGRALAGSLSWPEGSLPWDVYLLYPAGVVWEETIPPPAVWFHQREVGDPSRLRIGEDLGDALSEAVDSLQGPASVPAPIPAP